MPELAEVDYFRKQWNPGLKQRIEAVEIHGKKRIFRGIDTAQFAKALTGATLERSESRGKQMLFVAKKRGGKSTRVARPASRHDRRVARREARLHAGEARSSRPAAGEARAGFRGCADVRPRALCARRGRAEVVGEAAAGFALARVHA